jgi:CRP-like cAMP-binding protein
MRKISLPVLRSSVLFGGLHEQDLADVLATARVKKFVGGARVATQDEPADSVHLVRRGALKLAVADGDFTMTLRLVLPGEAIGENSALARTPSTFTARAAVPTETLFWPAAKFESLARTFPQIALNCIALGIARERRMLIRMRAASESAEKRIARAVVDLGATVKGSDGWIFAAGGRDIAELSDTTVYTVSRVLSQWKRQATVAGGRGKMRILNAPRLWQIIEKSD